MVQECASKRRAEQTLPPLYPGCFSLSVPPRSDLSQRWTHSCRRQQANSLSRPKSRAASCYGSSAIAATLPFAGPNRNTRDPQSDPASGHSQLTARVSADNGVDIQNIWALGSTASIRHPHRMETKGTMDRNNQATMWGWFLGGAALGGVVALLLAPKAGVQTRELIAGGAERGRKSLLQTGQEVFERGRELFERGREIADEAAQLLEKSRRIAEKTVEDRF